MTAVPAALQPFLKAFPNPTGTELGNGMAEFPLSYSTPSNLDATTIRVDHTINSKLTVFGRYNHSPSWNAALGSNLAENDTTLYQNWSVTGGATAVLTSHISNDLRLNWTGNSAFATHDLTTLGGAIPPPRSTIIPSQFDPA